MFGGKVSQRVVAGITLLGSFLLGGALSGAAAFSVDVRNLHYSDNSGRSVMYDFSASPAPVTNNAIQLPEAAVARGASETGTTYFWGQVSGMPAVAVTPDTNGLKATVGPTGAEGVAALYAGGGFMPTPTPPTSWFYSLELSNFNVDLSAQKAYEFDIGLGNDEGAVGPYNNAFIEVNWVKGFYNGTLYTSNTLIIQARVENGDNDYWESAPIVRTGLDPATTTLSFDLSVDSGNHFFAAVNINNEGMTNLGEYTLTAQQGAFLPMPALFPYLYMEEESASTEPQAMVQSMHFQSDGKYYASFVVQDPLHKASAVRVTGANYVGAGVDLIYDDNQKIWHSTQGSEIGPTPVTSPWPSFTFTFTEQAGQPAIDPQTKTITGYMTEFAANLLPSGSVSTNPVFSWTAPPGGASGYGVELNDGPTRIWNRYDIPPTQTSLVYSGPALVNGKTYNYWISSQLEQSGVWNFSLAQGSFTYTGTGSSTISFNGSVRTALNWPDTDGMLPVVGATVNALSEAGPPPFASATTNDAGAFSVTGIQPLSTFRLAIPTPASTTCVPVLSRWMNWNADINALLPFVLFTPAQYANFSNDAGTGMILGRVALKNSPMSFLAGAQIEAREWIAPIPPSTTPTLGATYPVTYTSGTATQTDGIFLVKSVPAGKMVQLVATLANHTFEFNGAVIMTQPGYISEESFFATQGTTVPVTTFSNESAFTTAVSNTTLIGFEDRDTSAGKAALSGNEYAGQGIIFASPNAQPLWAYPPPTSFWTWPSKYLSPGAAPFEGGDSNEDSLRLTFSSPVAAVGWTFLDMPNPNVVTIRLYDQGNALIHETANGSGITVNADNSAFWGVVSPTPIARVEILDGAYNGDDIGFDNFRFAVSAIPATISFSGVLKYQDNTAVNGGRVEMVGNGAIFTLTAPDGSFTVNGLPAGQPFTLKMTKPASNTTDYVPTYTAQMQSATSFSSPRSYNLYRSNDLTGWGVTSGGAIRGAVVDGANPTTGYIRGAVVTYTSLLNRTDYLVRYQDASGNPVESATGTLANGRYFILGVAEGDTVTVSVTQARGDYSFPNSRIFHTHGGAVQLGSVSGTLAAGKTAIVGYVKDNQDTPVGIAQATVEQVGASPANTTGSLNDGLFNLVIPQSTPVFLKFSKPAASPALAPTYSAQMGFGVTLADVGDFNLFPAAQLATWAITPGKGIIRARVKDLSDNYLEGAKVTAQGWSKSYPVCYDDACTASLTATQSSGRYVVKNVEDGDTVTVTAQMPGFTFNTRIFQTHGDSLHQGSVRVTGTQPVVTPHPETATIQARFEEAMAKFNANDFSEATGFAGFVSASYLDSGENRAQFILEAQEERTAHGVKTWTNLSVTGSGDYAAVSLTWNDGWVDKLHFRKESGVWVLYGNQALFDASANSGRQVYPVSPTPYWVSLSVEDPETTTGLMITGVKVTGPGLPTAGIDLYQNTGEKQWHSWSTGPSQANQSPSWSTAPPVPLEYVFTIHYTGGGRPSPEMQTLSIQSFVEAAPALGSLSPAANATATRPLTFSWNSAGTGYHYHVEVSDTSYNRIWDSDDVTGTSIDYNGPALGAGQYYYNLITEDGFGSMSMIQVPFQLPLLYPRTPVTTGAGVADNHPAWSPDGQKIAFTSNRSGIDNIWIVNRDGSGLAPLTTTTGYVSARYPSWSPDGTTIAYIVADLDPQVGGFGAFYLYTMNADGSGQTIRPLPPSAYQSQTDRFWGFEAKFTEWLDNDRIAFVSFGPEGGSLKLYSYRLSTGAVTQIVPTPNEVNPSGDIYKISWNAAKGQLAYDRWPVGIQTITDTGANYQVLDVPRAMQMDTPAQAGWRPDGNQLAFVKDLYGASNIAIFDTLSGTATVEKTATADRWPVWSPGGEAIAFVSDGKIWLMSVVPPVVNVTGTVLDWAGTAPLNGATVELLGVASPRTTVTDGNGVFTFDNVTPGQGFYLKIHSTGLREVYTRDLSFASTAGNVDLGTYNLPADADLAPFALAPNKGLIMGRVLDQQLGNGGRVGGAVVTATSPNHPAPGYSITYRSPLGVLGGTATYGNGRYYVLNVDGGEVVTVTATKANRPPAQRTFHTFAGALDQGSVRTQAPAYDASFSGTVVNATGTLQSSVRVELDRYPAKGMTTGTDGAFQIGGLPRDVNMNLKATKTGYLPVYTAGMNINGAFTGIPLKLFTRNDLTAMTVDPDKGLIAGLIVSNTRTPLAGAKVQVASNKGRTYVVNYGPTGGGTATQADGLFWIPDIVADDVVSITLSHPGQVFPGVSYLDGYGDAVTEKLFIGQLRPGDMDRSGSVDMADALLALKAAASDQSVPGMRDDYPTSGADVNGDHQAGMAEALYILQYLGGLRP
jgi:hypothetical protein